MAKDKKDDPSAKTEMWIVVRKQFRQLLGMPSEQKVPDILRESWWSYKKMADKVQAAHVPYHILAMMALIEGITPESMKLVRDEEAKKKPKPAPEPEEQPEPTNPSISQDEIDFWAMTPEGSRVQVDADGIKMGSYAGIESDGMLRIAIDGGDEALFAPNEVQILSVPDDEEEDDDLDISEEETEG